MLSAKQDLNRAVPRIPSVDTVDSRAVGKVVHSIQGLQQRLDDYTLQELTDAENRSRTMLVGLSKLQSRVRSLAGIKHCMTAVREGIEQATSDDFNLSTLESSDNTLHLSDVVQASNLIKFRAARKPQASRQSGSTGPLTTQSLTVVTDKPMVLEEVIEAPSTTDRDVSFVFGPDEMGTTSPNASAEFSWGDEPTKFHEQLANEVNFKDVKYSDEVKSTPDATDRTASDISQPQSDQPAQGAEEPSASTSTALVPSGGDFDQRLLDDLIRNYGEFVSSTALRTEFQGQSEIENKDAFNAEILLEAPAIERAKDNTDRALPLKKEGDIDRQLKKIIKDYGEYDIYSTQSPRNVKFAVIGAFLLLSAIFFGFYFISSKSDEPSTLPASEQPVSPSSGMDTSANRELKQSKNEWAKSVNNSPIAKK